MPSRLYLFTIVSVTLSLASLSYGQESTEEQSEQEALAEEKQALEPRIESAGDNAGVDNADNQNQYSPYVASRLQELGYFNPIDQPDTSLADAIKSYQEASNLPVTGTISIELLTSLGIL